MTQVAVETQIWNYQEVGQGKGMPLLILHGWGRNGNEWRRMAESLSVWSGRSAYVLDLPGFGGSSLPAQAGLPKVANMHEYSELVESFCEYMEIEKAVVIGHSLGGRVGILMGAKAKSRVEKLILVDPAGVKPKSIKRATLKSLAKFFGWVPKSWRASIVGSVMDEDYRNSPALRSLYRVVVAEDLRRYLPRINCPVLVVWGEQDPILPLALTKVYRDKLQDAVVRVVWGAGHDPHLSHYDQTLSILQEGVE